MHPQSVVFVFKKGRLTVSPEKALQACGLSPSDSSNHEEQDTIDPLLTSSGEGTKEAVIKDQGGNLSETSVSSGSKYELSWGEIESIRKKGP